MPSLPLTPHEDVARFVYPEACTLSPPPRDALDVVGGEGIKRSGRTLRSPAVIILFTVDIFSTSSSPNLLCVGCENTRVPHQNIVHMEQALYVVAVSKRCRKECIV